VLYEFAGPRIFTVRDTDGELHLVYWCDSEGEVTRYVVVPTMPRIVASLRAGTMGVWEALDQPRCWLCDVDQLGTPCACWSVDFRDIPDDALPLPQTRLWPELERQALQWEGRIREVDKDRLSFELRDRGGRQASQQFSFDPAMLDEVLQAFEEDARVKVEGQVAAAGLLARATSISRIGLAAAPA
jgi:hypothetical protein